MKHATMHVIIIKFSSSNRDYVFILERIFDKKNEKIVICIDINSSVNFIDESLLFSNNFYDRMRNCKSIIMRDIVDERIIDRQIDSFIYVRVINDTIILFNAHAYINKNIEVDVILNMNELNYEKNDITF